jgi:hypothetical protein
MITKEEIENAKRNFTPIEEPFYEHDDCIRIAYEWLDAQKKIKTQTRHARPLKHLIESWGGRYVSQSDVEIAAYLHPEIRGKYPFYNLSTGLTEPSIDRLKNISQAFTQDQRNRHRPADYGAKE